mmetsp:Transcript_112082/g.222779  ORF Transcript_112082/g.222779 Transcript_112082/m.222779 type:complete len:80 (+) Transcript_112082:486-725(+)
MARKGVLVLQIQNRKDLIYHTIATGIYPVLRKESGKREALCDVCFGSQPPFRKAFASCGPLQPLQLPPLPPTQLPASPP